MIATPARRSARTDVWIGIAIGAVFVLLQVVKILYVVPEAEAIDAGENWMLARPPSGRAPRASGAW